MKDAITYANEAGFFEFNVIGWKAEFERLIEAVRADAIADHIRDATNMVAGQAEQEPVIRATIAPPAPPEVYQMRSKEAFEAGWWEAQRQNAVSPRYAAPQPDYKALWEQMCKRCYELDSELAKYTEQGPTADVFKFLLGEGELEGCSFGEKPSNARGNFWWRTHLRKALSKETNHG